MPNTLAANAFATVVLTLWPIVVYALLRGLPRDAAIAIAILGGYLLLPGQVGIDLPLLPALTKDAVPVLAVAVMLWAGVAGPGAAAAPVAPPAGIWTRGALLVLLVLSPVLTTLTNRDPVALGRAMLPGMGLRDAGAVMADAAVMVLPWLVARRHFATAEAHVTLLKVLVLGLLAYALPILFELRMSPQLNILIYGFFPHEFAQHIRPGGYRPVVFLPHGLWLAILLAMAVLGAVALWRHRLSQGMRAGQWAWAAVGLIGVLALCNSLGALVIALALLPVAALPGLRMQLAAAALVAGLVLAYPALRMAHLLPLDRIVAAAALVSQDRAQSFQFRLDNEEDLARRAAERPLAGWGTWGRNMIHDPATGRATSVTDGAWIVTLGRFGWLGHAAQFGLLAGPVLALWLRRRRLGVQPATAGLALVLAANLLDLVPNATLTPVTWLIGGALAGYVAQRGAARQSPRAPAPRRDWALMTDPPPNPALRRDPAAAAAPQRRRRPRA